MEETLVPDAQVDRLLASAETFFTGGEVGAAVMLAAVPGRRAAAWSEK